MSAQQVNSFSNGNFVWFVGVVEDRMDPLELGRVKVRCVGYHSDNKGDIPTDHLHWAFVGQDPTSACLSGVGDAPVGILPGTWVTGFFMDGDMAQQPFITHSYGGRPSTKDASKGFNDPTGKYPTYPLGEIDTNRLATNRKISETIVQKKKDDLDISSVAFGGTWKEPQTPYNAKYPYNQVKETESGHVREYDNTPGAERLHLYHRKGTFEEIHPDGSKVTKVVKDNYTIIYGDDYLHVKGKCKITVDGDADILVKGNLNQETMGNKHEKVHGNYLLEIGGNFDMKTGGHQYETSGAHTKLVAPRIDLNP